MNNVTKHIITTYLCIYATIAFAIPCVIANDTQLAYDCQSVVRDRDVFITQVGNIDPLIDEASAGVIYTMLRGYCETIDAIPNTGWTMKERAVQSPYLMDHIFSVAMRRIACREGLVYPGTSCYSLGTYNGSAWQQLVKSYYDEERSPGDIYDDALPYWSLEDDTNVYATYMRMCPAMYKIMQTLHRNNMTSATSLDPTLYYKQCTSRVSHIIDKELSILEISLARQGNARIDNMMRDFGLVSYVDDGVSPLMETLERMVVNFTGIVHVVEHGTQTCQM